MEYIDNVETWLANHDVLSQKITLWVISLGFLACGWVGYRTWWRIRGTIDETPTGAALKQKKLAEGIAWTLMSILFGIALVGIYDLFVVNVMGRNAMRLLAGIAVWVVAGFGLLFLRAFEREDVLIHDKVDNRQDDRETAQNLREEQNIRDYEDHEQVNVRQDEREVEQNVREKFQDDRDEAIGST